MVKEADGMERRERVWPMLSPVGTSPDAMLQFGGLRPLLQVNSISPDSPLAPGGKREQDSLAVLNPGDVIVASTGA